MSDDLLPALERHLRASGLLPEGAPLLLAVSGGPDSLALAHLLLRLAPGWGWCLHAAHIDHGLDAEDAGTADYVAALLRGWGLTPTVMRCDTPGLMQRTGMGLQEAARAARYAALAEVALGCGAAAILVAHHADDQAETVLHHLIRGSGVEGLAGMRPTLPWPRWSTLAGRPELPDGPTLTRPLLPFRRADLGRYCAAQGIAALDDPANRLRIFTRNRLRHEVLPLLSELNPQVVEALGRTARHAAQQADDLAALLDVAWPALAMAGEGRVTLDGAAWRRLPPTLQRLALRRACAALLPALSLSAAQLDRAVAAAEGHAGLDLGGGLRISAGISGITLAVAAPSRGDSSS